MYIYIYRYIYIYIHIDRYIYIYIYIYIAIAFIAYIIGLRGGGLYAAGLPGVTTIYNIGYSKTYIVYRIYIMV